jgi:hypothetical protein
MMAQKAIMFNDLDSFNKIMIATNPYDQKTIGRNVKNFNKVQWEERAKDIVIAGNLGKFGQNKELREQMLLTADKKFVEASPTDKIWGIGMGLSEIESLNPEKITPDMWRGTNWLGECLDYVKMKLTLE